MSTKAKTKGGMVAIVLALTLAGGSARAAWLPWNVWEILAMSVSGGTLRGVIGWDFGDGGAENLSWRGYAVTHVTSSSGTPQYYWLYASSRGQDRCGGSTVWKSTWFTEKHGYATNLVQTLTGGGVYQSCTTGHAYRMVSEHYGKRYSSSTTVGKTVTTSL